MQQPGGGPDPGRGSTQDDLSDLLAPADVQFRPAPPPARPRRAPLPVPVPAPPPAPDEPDEPADLTPWIDDDGPAAAEPEPLVADAPPAEAPPVDTPVVDTRLVDEPLTEADESSPPAPAPIPVAAGPEPALPRPAPSPAPAGPAAPAAPSGDVITFGRWFQPVAGGVLPRPDATQPVVAVIRAAPGSTVHAVTAGHVRRAPVALAAGAVELAADDGSILVLTGPPDTVWLRDDEDVAAGEVLGALPTPAGVAAGGDAPGGAADVELHVLVIGPDGVPRDAVDVLVGLPDPGELDLGPGGGTDPFALDLEIAGRDERAGAR